MGYGRRSGRAVPLLLGERVRLREWSAAEHAAAWAGWLADPEVAHWVGGVHVEPSALTLAIERLEDGALIGGIALADLSEDRRAELVIAIGDGGDRGQGYGREAIGLLVRYALRDLRLREVFLRVHADNRRAVRCYLACGFVKEGVLVRQASDGPLAPVVLMSLRAASVRQGCAPVLRFPTRRRRDDAYAQAAAEGLRKEVGLALDEAAAVAFRQARDAQAEALGPGPEGQDRYARHVAAVQAVRDS